MPMSLLKFPAVASTPFSPADCRSIAASISLTVVLPLLPVIAIKGIAKRARQWLASRPSAARVSETTSSLASAPAFRGTWLTIAATAPAASACAANSWPSKRSPRMPTNRSPGRMSRLSVVTRANSAFAPTRRAPSACAALTRSSMASPAWQAPQDLARHFRIVERKPLAADFLIGFVTLSGNEDHVLERRPADGVQDRRCPVCFDRVVRVHPGKDFVDDRAGVLGPWIVAGNHHAISKTGRYF